MTVSTAGTIVLHPGHKMSTQTGQTGQGEHGISSACAQIGALIRSRKLETGSEYVIIENFDKNK